MRYNEIEKDFGVIKNKILSYNQTSINRIELKTETKIDEVVSVNKRNDAVGKSAMCVGAVSAISGIFSEDSRGLLVVIGSALIGTGVYFYKNRHQNITHEVEQIDVLNSIPEIQNYLYQLSDEIGSLWSDFMELEKRKVQDIISEEEKDEDRKSEKLYMTYSPKYIQMDIDDLMNRVFSLGQVTPLEFQNKWSSIINDWTETVLTSVNDVIKQQLAIYKEVLD